MEIVATAVYWLIEIVQWTIFLRVIVSWLPVRRENPLIRALFTVTEPILSPIRSIISKSSIGKNTMFDFSPIVAFLILSLISSLLF